MRRSRSRRVILVRLLSLLLAAPLLLGLFAALGGCANLGSGDTETTAPPDTGSTPTADAAQGGAGRISAENILFRDDFQDGDTDGWQVGGAWVVQQDGDLYTFDATGQGYAFVPAGVGWQGDYAFKTSYLLSAGTLGFSFDATAERPLLRVRRQGPHLPGQRRCRRRADRAHAGPGARGRRAALPDHGQEGRHHPGLRR